MSEDTKILAAVASVVVVGAVGLAVLGWMNVEDESERATASTRAGAQESRIKATPASYTPDPTPFRTAETPLVEAEFEAAAGEAFSIELGADYVQRGLDHYRSREFDESAAYFRAEIDERPGRAWTQYMLGLSLWKAGRLDEAATEMAIGAEMDAEPIRSWVNLSRIENDRCEFEAALDAARSAIAIDPDDSSALFLEGRSLRNLDRHDEALDSLTRSVEIDPENGHAHNLIGLSLLDLRRPFEAVASFETAAGLEPEIAYIRNNQGMALEHTGRRAEALEAYGRAIALDPSHSKAASNFARLEPLVAENVEITVVVDDGSAEAETVDLAEAVVAETSEVGESQP